MYEFKSVAPARVILSPKGTEYVVAVHSLTASVNSERPKPSVEIEAPCSHILEIFERHMGIKRRHIDGHSLRRAHHIVVRNYVLRSYVHIAGAYEKNGHYRYKYLFHNILK